MTLFVNSDVVQTCDDNSFAIDNPVAGSAGKSAVENECTNDFVTLQGILFMIHLLRSNHPTDWSQL